jgi:hypothetical protein
MPDTGNYNFHIGVVPPTSSFTQATGNILIKNARFYKNTTSSTLATLLNCTEDVTCQRGISATSFVSTSDVSVKTNIINASIDDCFAVFQAVEPKTYIRTDIGDGSTRCGFIAQDINNSIPNEFLNLVGHKYGGVQPLLQLDYSRLVVILWGACKRLEERINVLEGA